MGRRPVLVTGGAGYIGSVTVEALLARGERVVIVDNLSTGHRCAVPDAVDFRTLDLRDADAMARVLLQTNADAVIHFAAASLVGESVRDPAKYLENNVIGTLSLLNGMRRAGVDTIVFSSTAAVYGEPEEIPIPETHRKAPANPYGLTKRFMEQAMESYAAAYGLKPAFLRYFNAAGASATHGEHHDPESHLIPLVLQVALGQREHIQIFGSDYDTPDGTCIRDYIHVEDLAQAHLLALDHLRAGKEAPLVCNLGNGTGYSVKEVIDVCRAVTGHAIAVVEGPRRPGDPSRLIASAKKAREILGWEPKKPQLRTIVEDAWRWHLANPQGYPE